MFLGVHCHVVHVSAKVKAPLVPFTGQWSEEMWGGRYTVGITAEHGGSTLDIKQQHVELLGGTNKMRSTAQCHL
jgi:hypothetical protein